MKEETKGSEILVIDCLKHPEVFCFMNDLTVQAEWEHLTLKQAHNLAFMATAFHFKSMREAINKAKASTNCEHDGPYDKVIDYDRNGQLKAVCLRCKDC